MRFPVLLSACITMVFVLIACNHAAQVISNFNWNSNPVTNAAVGPNATSAGVTATSSTGGVGGTNGLNPGAPSPASDINLTIPNTGNVFDVNNVDISIDYRRNESTAQMIKRNTFTFNTGGTVATFKVTYRVNTGTLVTTVTSSAIAITQDNTFRNYRFTYDNCLGLGTMYINNSPVWTSSPTTPGQNLYWVGDGSVVIGQDMDGANNNIPNLDNFIWQTYTCTTTLPIELVDFKGVNEGISNYFEWSTASESNTDYFTIEKSTDGIQWQFVTRVQAAGRSVTSRSYFAHDRNPWRTLEYYRLVETDDDGTSKVAKVISIDRRANGDRQVIKRTDILGKDVAEDYRGAQVIFFSDGSVEKRLVQ